MDTNDRKTEKQRPRRSIHSWEDRPQRRGLMVEMRSVTGIK